MRKACLVILVLWAATGAGMRREEAVYASVDGRDLKATLYLPPDGRSRPALVCFHEGGFRSGDRACFEEYGNHFASRGIVVMAVSYRLVQQGGRYPAAIRDCMEAVKWLKAQSGRLGVDTARIALLGSSAGAYLAVMTALSEGLAPGIRAVVSSFGVYDWEKASWKGDGFLPRGMERQASPVYYARFARADFLVLAGETDRLFPLEDALRFADSLRKAGRAVEVKIMPKQDHEGLCLLDRGVGAWALPVMERFLRDKLEMK